MVRFLRNYKASDVARRFAEGKYLSEKTHRSKYNKQTSNSQIAKYIFPENLISRCN